MDASKQSWLQVITAVALLASGGRAMAGHPYAPESSMATYFRGQVEMVKAAAAMVDAKAAMLKAQAERNLARAKAAESLHKTRSLALDNDMKAANAFYQKKSAYENYQSLQKKRGRGTNEDYYRYSQMDVPERPAGYELEPVRGRIQWPPVLKQQEYVEARVQLDSLFAQRSQSSNAATAEIYGQVQSQVEQLRSDLKDNIDQISPAEYVAAKRFLDGLSYEAQFAPKADGVASK
jgi:ElaB/YqjD/DUF883 family membrane-anchored ribosome-binding protein